MPAFPAKPESFAIGTVLKNRIINVFSLKKFIQARNKPKYSRGVSIPQHADF